MADGLLRGIHGKNAINSFLVVDVFMRIWCYFAPIAIVVLVVLAVVVLVVLSVVVLVVLAVVVLVVLAVVVL